MKNRLKIPTLKWKPEFWWVVLLLAVLILLLVPSGILTGDEPDKPVPWSTPAVAPSTPTPAAASGWWDNMPTPEPLFPTPTPGGAP